MSRRVPCVWHDKHNCCLSPLKICAGLELSVVRGRVPHRTTPPRNSGTQAWSQERRSDKALIFGERLSRLASLTGGTLQPLACSHAGSLCLA